MIFTTRNHFSDKMQKKWQNYRWRVDNTELLKFFYSYPVIFTERWQPFLYLHFALVDPHAVGKNYMSAFNETNFCSLFDISFLGYIYILNKNIKFWCILPLAAEIYKIMFSLKIFNLSSLIKPCNYTLNN